MITLLAADDHPIIQDGLRRWVDTLDDMTILGTAASLTGLHALLEVHSPQVIIMDYRMPDVLGPQSVADLCAQGHRLVMFTSTEEEVIVRALYASGIVGFVSKSARIRELFGVVRKVAAGDTVLPGMEHIKALPHETLSPRELRVFEGLIQGQSPKEIAFEMDVATSSIYTYAERVRAKIKVEDTRELIEYAYAVGHMHTAQA